MEKNDEADFKKAGHCSLRLKSRDELLSLIEGNVVDEVAAGEIGVVDFPAPVPAEGEDEGVRFVEGVSVWGLGLFHVEAVEAFAIVGEVNAPGVPFDGVGMEIFPGFGGLARFVVGGVLAVFFGRG